MKKVKIAVLDTYVKTETLALGEFIHISDFYRSVNKENYMHGSAVCSLIFKECKDVEITVYPIFKKDDFTADVNDVLEVLYEIYKREDYNIINLSFGFISIEQEKELEKICDLLTARGTIIVAAYDNNGIMTYPAVFDNVIGVDRLPTKSATLPIQEYYYVDGSEINILGSNLIKRIGFNDRKLLANGTSFIVPQFVGKIANYILENDFVYDINSVKGYLKKNAKKIIRIEKEKKHQLIIEKINKAIVLPLNKENHSLVRFVNYLNFEIVDFYSFRQQLNIGEYISDIVKLDRKVIGDKKVKNIEKIDWDSDFDTVIIGHIDLLSNAKNFSALIMDILLNCVKYNKQVITYDDYIYNNFVKNSDCLKNIRLTYNVVDNDFIPAGRYGKLWYINKPIVQVLGTRSQIGKFTCQIYLKSAFEKKGYKLGFLSTEPQGILFGAKNVFPFGYNSLVKIDIKEYVPVLNELLHDIDKDNVDLILTGGQSGVVPYDLLNMERVLLEQIALQYGVNPDCVVLCVSCDDEDEYIERNIHFIESSTNSKVISIVLFPVIKEMKYIGYYVDKNIDGQEAYYERMQEIRNHFSLPVFESNEDALRRCSEVIIDFLSDQEDA